MIIDSWNRDEQVPVAIAGGGPSGLYCALALAQAGIASVVVEPRREVYRWRPRAKTTNARTMTLLRGLGIADDVRDRAPLPVEYSQQVTFCTGLAGHELRSFAGAFQLRTGRYELQPECGQQIPQPDVEQVLRDHAERNPLISVLYGFRTVGARSSDDGAELLITPTAEQETGAEATAATGQEAAPAPAPEPTAMSASYVIAADGGSSAVRKSLGIALEGTSAPRPNFNVVFRSHALGDRVRLDPAVQWWVIGERANGMIGELYPEDDLWWVILQGQEPAASDEEAAQMVRDLCDVGEDLDVEIIASDAWTARMLVATSYGYAESGGRVFLVGDAAHLNPPWGGHGFNTCIGDAANLVWKIQAVIEGWADASLLESYGLERRPVAQRMIADATANGKSLTYSFSNPLLYAEGPEGDVVRAETTRALTVKESEFHSEGLVLGYEYCESGRVTADGRPVPTVDPIIYTPAAAPGCLLPHMWLEDGSSVYDAVSGMTVFTTSSAAAEAVRTGLSAGGLAVACPISVVELAGADAQAARDRWEAQVIVVRPDHHVAARFAHLAQAQALVAEATARALR